MKILEAGKNDGVRSLALASLVIQRVGATARAETRRARGAAERIATRLRGAERSRGPTRALRRLSFPLVSLSGAAYGVRFVQERKLLRFPGLDGTIMKIDSGASHANASAARV